MMRTRPLALTALVAAVAMLAGCGGGGGSSEDDSTTGGPTTVKVAFVPVITKAPLYLGIEKGFFEELGLKIEPQPVTTGAAITAGVTSGEIEIGGSALEPQILARTKGVPVQIVATGSALSPPQSPTAPYSGAQVMVKSGGSIKSAKHLDGKTIAVNALRAAIELVTRSAADRLGAEPATFEYVAIPFPEMGSALQSGRVDAIAPVEPFVRANRDGADVLFAAYPYEPASATQYIDSVWFTSEETLEEDPDVVARFVEGIQRANAYAQRHPGETRAVVPTYTELEPQVASELPLPDFPAELDRAAYQADADLMRKYGFVDQPPNLDDLIVDVTR